MKNGCATIVLNGGLYDIVSQDNGETWCGTLHGEDTETGARWEMVFELPRTAAKHLAVIGLETVEDNHAPF